MKIALVLDQFNIKRGGAERSTAEMAAALAGLGAQVSILAHKVMLDGARELPFAVRQVPVRALTRRGRAQAFEKALAAIRQNREYDIVQSIVPFPAADIYQPRGGSQLHALDRHLATYPEPARSLKHLSAPLNRARAWRLQRERLVATGAEGPIIACPSDYVRRQFSNLYGTPPERLRLIRNGVNIERFRDEETRARGRRLRQHFDPDGKLALFLFAAEDYRRKGLAPLLAGAHRALQLHTDQRDFRILVFGRENYSAYYRQAEKLHLRGKVLFMGATAEIPALITMSDAVILPTWEDACSRLVLEALAAGRPAITTRDNGAAEFLGENEFGHVIDTPASREQMALALLDLCHLDKQTQMCRKIEQARLHEQVSMARHAAELMELYKNFTGR